MKQKYTTEYSFMSISPAILWNFIYLPNSMSEWFADNVSVDGKIYTFTWNKSPQQAELVNWRLNRFVRFRWCDESSKAYFEFHIEQIDLTNETIFSIVDFAEPEDIEEERELWKAQVTRLKKLVGVL